MIVTLLFSIAGGMLVVLGLARVADIAWKFVRLIGLLTLAMTCLATAWVYRDLSIPEAGTFSRAIIGCGLALGLGTVALVVIAPIVNCAPQTIRILSLLAGVAGVAASALSSIQLPTVQYRSAPGTAAIVLSQVLGSWMLGSITVAWLLGHAYLTATKMTIAPLRFFSRMLSAAIVARFVFFITILILAWLLQHGQSVSLWTRLEQSWIIVLLRVGVGLVAPAIFAYMVSDCVRLRSTQSATGILYFASVMAYVGELASQFLTRELGWPV